jgi:hypothetical protein
VRKVGLCFAGILATALTINSMVSEDGNVSAGKDKPDALQKERVIKEKALPNLAGTTPSPIEVVDFANEDTVFRPGEFIVKGEGWLKGLKTKIRNKSDKVITHAALVVCATNPENEGQRDDVCTIVAAYGQFNLLRNSSLTIRINPGEIVSASFSDINLDVLKKRGEEKGMVSLEQLVLDVDQVLFEDMTLWRKGYLLRQHPNHPNAWVRIGKEDLFEKEMELRKKKPMNDNKNNNIGYQHISPRFEEKQDQNHQTSRFANRRGSTTAQPPPHAS